LKFPTITIEGMIISADILDKIEAGEIDGQSPKHFGLEGSQKVKDEIARIWADCQDLWQVYSRQMNKIGDTASGAAETRRYWMLPLLGLLGYDTQNAKAEIINEKSYAISHRAVNLDGFPVHIMGFNDKLGEKRQDGGPRLSPHSLVQEYINITEHLYALVSNGLRLRLLRDNSRLIKQSYIEFDLQAMMEENHYADFAVMVRLLHATRMTYKLDTGDSSWIEKYHQDSLDSGSRIREKLSEAVEKSILLLGNGFLQHPDNEALRNAIAEKHLTAEQLYQLQLRLIYRLLFLLVIEERQLIYPQNCDSRKREIYSRYYSLSRLRELAESRSLEEGNYSDLWISLKQTFRLFEDTAHGARLGVQPLNGELFGPGGLTVLETCSLGNKALLECIAHLSRYSDDSGRQMIRVNYAGLNVEEFGSVYEGLLEYAPQVEQQNGRWTFRFVKGTERSSSGTHYTPDELVLPLIKHSLDYIIQDKLKAPLEKATRKPYDAKKGKWPQDGAEANLVRKEQEEGLLSIKVCDVACGSGHILLNAARRIAQTLATVRSGEEQPSPEVLRPAIRDVISRCIYGVDKNPLAVELCKVALWLEAHNPGEPLSFLDHRIKCGDAIVGLAHMQELQNGISDEAFKPLPGDDKTVCRMLRDKNKAERAEQKRREEYAKVLFKGVDSLAQAFSQLDAMPDHNPRHVCDKSEAYLALISGAEYMRLKTLADIQTAQFFLPKEKAGDCITDGTFREYLAGRAMQGQAVAKAMALAVEKRFFHWFLEFPEVMANGGFDCILGNPPFLGGQKISGMFGKNYLEYLKIAYAPAGSCDIVTYFYRRIFTIIRQNGFQSLLATNTIAQGGAREGGLDVITKSGGTINHAVRSMRWPGAAAVEVALVTIYKGQWTGTLTLNRKPVQQITSYLDDAEELGNPFPLKQNEGKSFQGSIVLGMGFILNPEEAQRLIELDPRNKEVIFPYLNGDDLNSRQDQSPSRWVINFHDWPIEKARQYKKPFEIVERLVKPERTRKKPNGEFALRKPMPQKWWIYAEKRPKLYQTIAPLERVLVVARISKTVAFTFVPKDIVYADALVVHALNDWASFALLQSSINYNWAWNYCTTMKTDLNYTPTATFEKLPFPQLPSSACYRRLNEIGKTYYEHRLKLMTACQLGLTKIYTQFHNSNLSHIIQGQMGNFLDTEDKLENYGKDTLNLWKHLHNSNNVCSFNEAVAGIHELRRLHLEMDQAVLAAYGWDKDGPDGPAIDLRHDFYEVDYLPENDRIRFTIHPDARREILKRLLLLNHRIHEREVKDGLCDKNAIRTKEQNNQIQFDI